LQQAFVDEQAAQCGYCISGMLISATELLQKNQQPTEADVRAVLDKHLCRCGTHNRIVRAVLRAAAKVAV
jgi:nicotinate dehydrogenase subunit A